MPDFSGQSPHHNMFGGIHLQEVKTNKSPTVHQWPGKPQGDISDDYGFK